MSTEFAIRTIVDIILVITLFFMILHEDWFIAKEEKIKRYLKGVKKNFEREFKKSRRL